MIRKLLVILGSITLISSPALAQIKLSGMTRSTPTTGANDSSLYLLTDSATRTRAITLANLRSALYSGGGTSSNPQFNSLGVGTTASGTQGYSDFTAASTANFFIHPGAGIGYSTATAIGFYVTNASRMLLNTVSLSPTTDSALSIGDATHRWSSVFGTGHYYATQVNDTALVGEVGYLLHHETAINTTLSLSNGSYTAVDSISVTPGNWDCSGVGIFRDTSATTTQFRANVDSVRASTAVIYRLATLPISISGVVDTTALPTPVFRVSISATTKMYLNVMSMFSTNKVYGAGGLRCSRPR